MLRLLAVGLAALSLAAAGTASARSTSSCSRVSPAVIYHVLGVTVGPLTQVSGHGSLTCSYSVRGVPDAVKVTFTQNVSAAAFAATATSFRHAYTHAHSVHGLGDSAFTASQGSGPFASTILFVHQGTNEVDVTAVAPLAKCEHLARLLLPHA